jgi:hypothetical protein
MMSLSVQARAEYVATFRYVQVFLMETLARWTPQTPEMEVKVLFGRHIWDLAQQADLLGRRTYELRAPLQFSLRPIDAYANFLDEFARTDTTPKKLAGFYEVMLPSLEVRYRQYLKQTDHLLDEPTVRVINRILDDFVRMKAESEALRNDLPALRSHDRQWIAQLKTREAADADIVQHRPLEAIA